MIPNAKSIIEANVFSALAYLPDDLNHFQEFTHFLDSIGLPAEWLPTEFEATQVHEPGAENIQKTAPASQEQSSSRRGLRDDSRADSPFRSWLPSVPRGDQSLGALSDSGRSSYIAQEPGLSLSFRG